jgi:hypothetical protein
MTKEDHNALIAKGALYANMAKEEHIAMIATVRIYANQDTTHIIQAVEL